MCNFPEARLVNHYGQDTLLNLLLKHRVAIDYSVNHSYLQPALTILYLSLVGVYNLLDATTYTANFSVNWIDLWVYQKYVFFQKRFTVIFFAPRIKKKKIALVRNIFFFLRFKIQELAKANFLCKGLTRHPENSPEHRYYHSRILILFQYSYKITSLLFTPVYGTRLICKRKSRVGGWG